MGTESYCAVNDRLQLTINAMTGLRIIPLSSFVSPKLFLRYLSGVEMLDGLVASAADEQIMR